MFRHRCVSTWGVRCPTVVWCVILTRVFRDNRHFHAEVYFHVSVPLWRGLIQPARTSQFSVCHLSVIQLPRRQFVAPKIIWISRYFNIEMSNFTQGFWCLLAIMTDSGCQGNAILFLHFSHDALRVTVGPLSSSLRPTELLGSGDWWRGLASLTVDIYREPLLGIPVLLDRLQTNRRSNGWKCSRRGWNWQCARISL